MTGDQIASLAYLGLLGGALAMWFVITDRARLGQNMRNLALWGLIFLGVIAAVGLWDDIRATVAPQQAVFAQEGRIELPRGPDGHYYATVDVNGTPTRFVVDTGASMLVLTRDDARRAGIDPDDLSYFSEAMTANGAVATAPVTLDSVSIGPFADRHVRAFVNGGEMSQSLLGMSYLQQFSRVEIADNRMVLER